MPVPDFQSFFIPMLQRATDGNEHSMADLREGIAGELNLTPEDLSQKLPSGVQTAFANRVAWSAVYLAKAGALERVKRGVFKITARGQELLALRLPKLTIQNLSKYPEFHAFYKPGSSDDSGQVENTEKPETPEEQLANAYKLIRETLANEILEMVKTSSPSFFERAVVDLLVAMGYGGSLKDAGKAVGRTGDDGIDGIIKEDRLGLDAVYIQAKRWTASGASRDSSVRREPRRASREEGRIYHDLAVQQRRA